MTNLDKDFYIENGYIVFKKLISHQKIDYLLDEFDNFKNNGSIYYSQSHHNWRSCKEDTDDFGLLECSIENFTDLFWAKKLRKLGLEILLSDEINECLSSISDSNEFAMWQNMFFDKSVGTADHFDSWYLDTDPPGNLVGAWIALEDIDGNGGSFHIYPKSHTVDFSDTYFMVHDDFLKFSKKEKNKFAKVELKINKGDVVFWHPNLLHGSSLQNISGCSRKSLTAHYFPVTHKKTIGGFKGTISDATAESYKSEVKKQLRMMKTFGYKIATKKNKLIFFDSLRGYIKFKLNFRNGVRWLMGRDNYK